MCGSRWIPAVLLLVFVLQAPVSRGIAAPEPASPSTGQQQSPPPPTARQEPSHGDPQFDRDRNGIPRPDETVEKQMERDRQRERWRDIKRRSEKLLEVATELKQYVDRSGENVMSLEVIKKASEMEKLSKDLQKRMKGE